MSGEEPQEVQDLIDSILFFRANIPDPYEQNISLAFNSLAGQNAHENNFAASWCAQTATPGAPNGPCLCGNGVIDEGETCDDGNVVSELCPMENPNCEICDRKCQLVTGSIGSCGDKILAGDEECDYGEFNADQCADGVSRCIVCDTTTCRFQRF